MNNTKMSIIIIIVIAFAGLVFFTFYKPYKPSSSMIHAKRSAPATIPPVVYHQIKYTALQYSAAPSPGSVYIEAVDTKTGNMLWNKQIYGVSIDPKMETDVQEIYLKSLTLEKNKLVAINELNERFEIDLITGDSAKSTSTQVRITQ